MSKCLEFGPDQNFKPRNPQAAETSGSQLWRVHPRGDTEQPQGGGKHEKPPEIPSSLGSHIFPVSSLFLLFPISFTQLPLLKQMQICNYSEALRRSRSHGAVGRRMLLVRSLSCRDHGLGLGLHSRKGQDRQDFAQPDKVPVARMSSRRKEKGTG